MQALLREFNAAAKVVGPHAKPLLAETCWGWVVIDVVAVRPDVRGHGLGTRIVRVAECAEIP